MTTKNTAAQEAQTKLTEATTAKESAQTAKNNADKAVEDAQTALDEAIQAYRDLTGSEPADNTNPPQTAGDDSTINNQDNPTIDSSGTDPGGNNASTDDSSSGDASGGDGTTDTGDTEESGDTPPTTTSDEVAEAQQKVDDARDALGRAQSAQTQAGIDLNDAITAESTAQTNKDTADGELTAAQEKETEARLEVERLQGLINGGSDTPSDLQDLAEALKNAEAATNAKDLEVKRITGELATLTADLEAETEKLEAAEALLANSAKLLEEAEKAEAAEQKAQQDYDLAFAKNEATFTAMNDAEGVCTKLEKQEDAQLATITDLEAEQTRIQDEEVDPKDEAYRAVLDSLDPSVYDDDRIAAINQAETTLTEAQKAQGIANTRFIEASAQAQLADEKQAAAEQAQGRVNALTYSTDPTNFITEPGYEYLNNSIDAIRSAEDTVAEKAQLKADAEKEMKSKELAHTAAVNELNRATAAAAAAQAEYNRLAGITTPENPGDNNKPTNPGTTEKPTNPGTTEKPGSSTSGGNNSGTNNSGVKPNTGTGNNGGNSAGNGNGDGSQDGTVAESAEETTVEASLTTNANAPVKKVASSKSVDPFVIIVGGALVIAAAAVITAAVVRSRRIKNEAANEEA